MKRIFTLMAVLFTSIATFAQPKQEKIINWSYEQKQTDTEGVYSIIFTGKIADGYHTYTLTDEYSATEFMDVVTTDCELVGKPYEVSTPSDVIDEFGEPAKHYYGEIVIGQDIKITGPDPKWNFTIFTNSCTAGACIPEYNEFQIKPSGVQTESNSNIWALILEAILWGLAMLLTPCVFPMVPMTVSFFMKGSENAANGRFKAIMYGIFIVVLYTVPISVIIAMTKFIGGDAVTADIFNWLSTHWIPNVIFFVVFMIFAASFFGAFEITLPQSLVNKSDKNADKGGLLGIFFMALTLVLVSFSCTGPIVGSVLIKSTQGEFWEPMATMLAFSIAFAIPFTIFAFFPTLLNKFKKSGGGWLNSVKVVLGFIELALGLKFLSTADQTYHWGLLDREIYLAIWIVIFTLLGLYLLGKIRFAHDEPIEHLSVPRLTLAIAVFSFVVYLFPGMWGAPLKGISGYLPPITSQDFVVGQEVSVKDSKYGLALPLGLKGHFTLKEGIAAAKQENKPIFVDVTGHGCVNCREMESRVWSDSRVLDMLKNDFIIVALYTDDKQELHEEDWVTDENTGTVYKDMGRANGYIARSKWNVNSQPGYILLSPDGEQLVPARGYDLSVDGFIDFLESGLNANKD